MTFAIGNFTITCEAGGPYSPPASVLVYGNITNYTGAVVSSATMQLSLYNSSGSYYSASASSHSDGWYYASLSGVANGTYILNVTSKIGAVTGNCTDTVVVNLGEGPPGVVNESTCYYRSYPISGWALASSSGAPVSSGNINVYVQETGDSYTTSFTGGYFSVSPTFCLRPGVMYTFSIQIESSGRKGFIIYRTVGKG